MTIEEIIAKAKEDANFRKALVTYSSSTEEGKEILNNFAIAEYDKKIKDKVSEIHTAYDNDIHEILGERKETNQKSYDFVKKLVGELKELRIKSPDDKDEKIKELNLKIKEFEDSGSHNEHWKNTYEEALKKWEEKEQELNDSIKTIKSEFSGNTVLSELNAAKAGLKFIDSIPDEAINAMYEVEKNKILKNAKIENGKITYFNEDGSPAMNESYKPVSAQEILAKSLGVVLAVKESSGGGAPANIKFGEIHTEGEGDNAKSKLVLDKESFKSKTEFQEVAAKALKNQGVAMGDEKYDALLDGAYAEYEVEKLEM